VLLGVAVRTDDLAAWREQAGVAFSQGMPLLVNLDGYAFLSMARDLLEGGYAAVDPLRAAPMGAPRPDPPPLLALITGGVTRLTGAPLDWVAAYLPALAGPLAAVPVFLAGRRIAGAAAGLAAALVTVLSVYYTARTTFGFHDADCLTVFFATALAWWSLALDPGPRARPWRWVLQGAVLYGLFLWWWTDAWPLVTALAMWSLICALGACGWRRRDVIAALAACAAIAAGLIAWHGAALPGALAGRVRAMLEHAARDTTAGFPDAVPSIAEQTPMALADLGEQTLGDPLLLAVAAAGLAWLMVARPRAGIVLLAPLGLALLGVLLAQRYLIFAAPLTGLGVGWLAARGMAAVGPSTWRRGAVAAGVLAIAAPAFARATGVVHYPAAGAEVASGLRWLAREAPDDAVVWAMWDRGPMLRYVARRATVSDAAAQTGDLTVYTALPFAAQSFREAANFMQFYARHGRPGLERLYRAMGGPGPGLALARRVFAAGPAAGRALVESAALEPFGAGGGAKSWLAFLFPADAPPRYLLTDRHMLRSAQWWFRFGSWDPGSGEGHAGYLRPFPGLVLEGAIARGETLTVDLVAGTAAVDGEPPRPLSRIVVSGRGGLRSRDFHPDGPEFLFHTGQGLGALADARVARSVFSNAFVLQTAPPAHFRAARQEPRRFQIWEVRGDALRPEASRRAGMERTGAPKRASRHPLPGPG